MMDYHEKYILTESGQAGMTETGDFNTEIPEKPATFHGNIAEWSL